MTVTLIVHFFVSNMASTLQVRTSMIVRHEGKGMGVSNLDSLRIGLIGD